MKLLEKKNIAEILIIEKNNSLSTIYKLKFERKTPAIYSMR